MRDAQHPTVTDGQRESLNILYDKLLEALRHREQEIFRYIALVVPSVVGLVGLSVFGSTLPMVRLIAISVGLQLLAGLGAWYSLALGYNYRYVLAGIRSLEEALEIVQFMVRPWTRSCSQSRWCWPPEVIKVFWVSFVLLIVFTAVTSCFINSSVGVIVAVSISSALFLAIVVLFLPWHYGRKLLRYADARPK